MLFAPAAAVSPSSAAPTTAVAERSRNFRRVIVFPEEFPDEDEFVIGLDLNDQLTESNSCVMLSHSSGSDFSQNDLPARRYQYPALPRSPSLRCRYACTHAPSLPSSS